MTDGLALCLLTCAGVAFYALTRHACEWMAKERDTRESDTVNAIRVVSCPD